MRILFLGDYSNLHACLAAELRRRGHQVTVISDGGRYMRTSSDYLLVRDAGLKGGLKYIAEVATLLPKLKDYDVVQLINPNFFSLKPAKIKYIFDFLRRRNRSVFLTLAGNDYFFVKNCLEGKMFRFSEFMVGNNPTEYELTSRHGQKWCCEENRRLNSYIYDRIDGAMSVLPEYDMAARPLLGERLVFTNIPIDFSSLPFRELKIEGPVKFFIGIREGMEVQKGTGRLLEICHRLETKYPGKCVTEVARNLPLNVYLQRMADSHVVLDQLYSYSPGTNGFQAMALGRVAATGGQLEYFRYIGETENRALLPLSPLEDTEAQLSNLINNPEIMTVMGREGRRLVETYNDVKIVADKFEQHWNKILNR